ncbi:hypothetical protein CPG37_01005 [Malaciobacter canalis]|jgi:hypothetical protein|uniref:Uncharacterized protein n=2 Tax=Malaciobacter TaxID=2321114 RepID=A0AB36ZYH1_9BACT|nr:MULTISPECIES: hypothetical protein [Malaciobacter]PHO11056.1 hypothetical protein CPG37_01005 [Malaciobacter canalis]PPK62969.1 hypothetical protein B0F89_101169 [Malaciobacter marinus]QEE33135.1 putative membrane protein [Malaciobacter canalis]SKB37359.1 hypothetical protein SAMN06295997_1087 [Malaciobacter marinus]
MKRNIFDNILTVVFVFFFTIIVNFISSIYFNPIFLIGVLFLTFMHTIKREYYYSAFFLTLAMLFLELNNGFKPFSLLLLSFFVYAFIASYIKRVVSFSQLNDYIYILVFYFGFTILYIMNNTYSYELFFTIFINIVIDFIIVGLMI